MTISSWIEHIEYEIPSNGAKSHKIFEFRTFVDPVIRDDLAPSSPSRAGLAGFQLENGGTRTLFAPLRKNFHLFENSFENRALAV